MGEDLPSALARIAIRMIPAAPPAPLAVTSQAVDALLEAALLAFRAEQTVAAKFLDYDSERAALETRLRAVLARERGG